MRRLEAVVVGLCLGVFALGAALVPLQFAWFTRSLSTRFSELPQALALPLAEASRKLVVLGDLEAREALLRVMTPDAVTHLDDVRNVIVAANVATAVLALALAAWALLRREELGVIGRALRSGATAVAAFVLLAIGIALVDFDAFFSAFHGLFFEPGTWVFPSDSVLIRLFPEPFWMSAGGVWGVLVLVIAAAYWFGGSALLRRARA